MEQYTLRDPLSKEAEKWCRAPDDSIGRMRKEREHNHHYQDDI
jgi:hypothetical protein